MSMYCGLESTLIENEFYHLYAWKPHNPQHQSRSKHFYVLNVSVDHLKDSLYLYYFFIYKMSCCLLVYRLPILDKLHCIITQSIRLYVSQRNAVLTIVFSIIHLCTFYKGINTNKMFKSDLGRICLMVPEYLFASSWTVAPSLLLLQGRLDLGSGELSSFSNTWSHSL
jgi:hypothetical protein